MPPHYFQLLLRRIYDAVAARGPLHCSELCDVLQLPYDRPIRVVNAASREDFAIVSDRVVLKLTFVP